MSVSLSTDNYKNLNDALDRLLEAGEKRQMQPDDVQRGILLLWTKVQSEARNVRIVGKRASRNVPGWVRRGIGNASPSHCD